MRRQSARARARGVIDTFPARLKSFYFRPASCSGTGSDVNNCLSRRDQLLNGVADGVRLLHSQIHVCI